MKASVSGIESILKKNHKKLTKLHVKALFVFGSVATGKSSEQSDIDLIVEFSKDVGMFDFLELKYFLEDILKSEVDLATEKALHPSLKESILQEAVRVA